VDGKGPSSRDGRTDVLVGNVVRRWKGGVRASATAPVVLSPYVTSDTAERVLEVAGGKPARLYTLFEAHLFASGASQLATLRRLALLGVQLFHLPGLHAKVVLTDSLATIGSQNLTKGGTTRLEATACISDQSVIRRLHSDIAKWLDTAVPITDEQIAAMDAVLPALQREFRRYMKSAARTDASVASDQQTRRAAREERERDERKRREASDRLERLRQMIAGTDRSQETVPVRLAPPPHETLLVRNRGDLTRWIVQATRTKLHKRKRYLVIAPNGRLAWAALNKTRLTQFGTGLDDTALELGGRVVFASWEAPDATLDGNANVVIHLKAPGEPRIAVHVWFDTSTVEILSIQPAIPPWLANHVESERDAFAGELARFILKPFRYKRNRTGLTATAFLGDGAERCFRVQLHRRGDFEFLVIHPSAA